VVEQANHLPAGAVRLNVTPQGWLKELWLCLDTRFQPRVCPAAQGGAAADAHVRVLAQP
jgi:ribonuclease T2